MILIVFSILKKCLNIDPDLSLYIYKVTLLEISKHTFLSSIMWVMFLTHHCLPKVGTNCQKKAKVDIQHTLFK